MLFATANDNSLESLDLGGHLLTRIRTVIVLSAIHRPLSHQDIVVIVRKRLSRLRQNLVNGISENRNIPLRVIINSSQKFIIRILVL